MLVNIILVSISIFLNVAFISKLLHSAKQAIMIEEKESHMRALETYIQVINESTRQTREFKHDYMNILLTLDLLIKERKYDELEAYYNEYILPTKNQLKYDDKKLLPLSNIIDRPIKSLLISKFNSALSKHINCRFAIDEFISIPVLSPVETARILGILLDNAIEAALTSEQPAISFCCTETEHNCIIKISNTFYSEPVISIDKIKELGFSTKGKDRGMGLYNVSKILDKYKNINHLINISDDVFTFTIIIKDQ